MYVKYLLTAIFWSLCLAPQNNPSSDASNTKQTEKKWIAFVASSTPLDLTGYFASQSPRCILYEDGRIIWREEPAYSNSSVFACNDPTLWREGKVAPEALSEFISQMSQSKFFQVQQKNIFFYKGAGLHAPWDTIGVSIADKKRILSAEYIQFYSEQPEADAYWHELGQMRKALLALRPKTSTEYTPESIHVNFFSELVRPEDRKNKVQWPTKERFPSQKDFTKSYSGPVAKKIIAVLAKQLSVTDGRRTLMAWWRPDIAIPK